MLEDISRPGAFEYQSGLLGINVGGIPPANSTMGFAVIASLSSVIAVVL